MSHGRVVQLHAPDGFAFDAYRVPPGDARRGGLVLLHAIWGVTPHLRGLADRLAGEGWDVAVPSLLDRFERGFPEGDRDPTRKEIRAAYAAQARQGLDCLDAVQAAIDALSPPVFAMGFCFGGTTTWLAAARCAGLSGVACFYGGHIVDYADETPLCPAILHFGKRDELIPSEDVERIAERHPDLALWLYDAGHAFVAPGPDHQPDAAQLAMLRTLQFFHRTGGKGEMGG